MDRLSQEEFIAKCREKHGDRYDYSLVNYEGRTKKIIIICPDHGMFSQSAHSHAGGAGCRLCASKKRKETNLLRYGVEVTSKAQSVKDKARKTCLDRYGAAGPQGNAAIRSKSVATWIEKYGSDNPMGSEECREKIHQTHLERHGVDWPSQCKEIRDKQKATSLERYGCESPLGSEAVREKSAATCMELYGGHPMFNDDVKNRVATTNVERYGGHPMKTAESKAKMENTFLERYGGFPLQSDEFRKKLYETKKQNGSFHTSAPEDTAYAMLVRKFGEDDVQRNYWSDAYPHSVDFYVRSLDLYIEMNLSWTHGGKFYDGSSVEDRAKADLWRSRGGKYYENAVYVWTILDPKKKTDAEANNLNYKVFWDNDLSDFKEWLESV